MCSSGALRVSSVRGLWLVRMYAALVALIVVAATRNDVSGIWWTVLHVSPLIALGVITSYPLGRRLGTHAVTIYAVVLSALAWLVGFGILDPWNETERLQLFTGNPNLLGADLVAGFLAASMLRPRWPWLWALPVVAIAVTFTGSRTALIALAGAAFAWAILRTTAPRTKGLLAASTFVTLGFLVITNHQIRMDEANHNLLPISVTFDDRRWTVYRDSVVDVEPSVRNGPVSGTRADRIVATAGTTRLTLLQSFGRSEVGVPYVASVYLAADSPQTVILSSHHSRTTCQVDVSWSRCSTPPGFGDGRGNTQFRLEATGPGETFDVYAYGPQYETGMAATEYQPRVGGLLPNIDTSRFTMLASSPQTLIASRVAPIALGWNIFMVNPWLGSGVGWSQRIEVPSGATHYAHAHNLLVERLATDGIAGTLAWMLIAACLLGPPLRAFGWRAVPWLVGLLVLNTLDVTWFHTGSYISTAIVAGSALHRLACASAVHAKRSETR